MDRKTNGLATTQIDHGARLQAGGLSDATYLGLKSRAQLSRTRSKRDRARGGERELRAMH